MVLCCGSTKSVQTKPIESKTSRAGSDEIVGGCYLTFDDNELYFAWHSEPPEGTVILYAKPTKKLPLGKLTGESKFLAKVEDNAHFFKGLMEWVKEAAPCLPTIKIMSDANDNSLVPFMLASHQPGNGVIGDRTLKTTAGGGALYVEGCDGIAAVPATATCYDERNQTVEDFFSSAEAAGGCYLKLDPSGRTPPKVMYG